MNIQNLHPGPPYHYVCLKCKHTFTSSRRAFWGVCPKCRSLKVIEDPRICK